MTHLEIQKLSTQLSCAIASAMKLVDQKSTCALFATVDKLDHFTLGKKWFCHASSTVVHESVLRRNMSWWQRRHNTLPPLQPLQLPQCPTFPFVRHQTGLQPRPRRSALLPAAPSAAVSPSLSSWLPQVPLDEPSLLHALGITDAKQRRRGPSRGPSRKGANHECFVLETFFLVCWLGNNPSLGVQDANMV